MRGILRSTMARPRLRRSATLVALTVALLVGFLFPGAASAAVRHNAGWASGNWAGYIIDDGDPYTSITAQWVVPTVSTSQLGFSAAWLGVDGVSNSRLIQVGTEHDSYGGQAHYWAWWEVLPAAAVRITAFRVRPGDLITASITKVGTSRWQISISNKGHGSFTTTRTYTGRATSAEWIVEAPTINDRQAVLARHGPVKFDRIKANGSNPRLRIDESGVLIQFHRRVAVPSAPDAQGDGFTVKRV
jgi:hypothetical protein